VIGARAQSLLAAAVEIAGAARPSF
jgi:hypothetical protein